RLGQISSCLGFCSSPVQNGCPESCIVMFGGRPGNKSPFYSFSQQKLYLCIIKQYTRKIKGRYFLTYGRVYFIIVRKANSATNKLSINICKVLRSPGVIQRIHHINQCTGCYKVFSC